MIDLEQLMRKLDDVITQISSIRRSITRMDQSMETVINEYRRYGSAIEYLNQDVSRLKFHCPLLRPPTDEYPEVCEDAGDGDGTKIKQG